MCLGNTQAKGRCYMASVYIKDGHYYFSFYDSYGKRHQKSTGLKVDQYGKREGKQLALKQANDQEFLHNGARNNTLSFIDLLGAVERLSPSDKTKLAMAIADHAPDRHDKITTTLTYLQVRDKWLGKLDKSDTWLKDEQSRHPIFFNWQYNDQQVGNMSIAEINTELIDDFIRYCKDQGKAPNTIKNYLKPVNQLFNYAVANDIINKNPKEYAQQIGSATTMEWEYINDEAFDYAIDNASYDEDVILWTWLRYTGLNPKDVSLLTPDQVEDNIDCAGRNLNNGRSKNGRLQRIPLNDQLEKLLDRYGDQCFGVFTSKHERDNSNKRFKKLIARKGVKSTLGTVRHTYLTNLVNYGQLSLDDIAIIAGHADTKMLKRVYIKKADQEKVHKASNKLR